MIGKTKKKGSARNASEEDVINRVDSNEKNMVDITIASFTTPTDVRAEIEEKRAKGSWVTLKNRSCVIECK